MSVFLELRLKRFYVKCLIIKTLYNSFVSPRHWSVRTVWDPIYLCFLRTGWRGGGEEKKGEGGEREGKGVGGGEAEGEGGTSRKKERKRKKKR